jgi:hypothetical protein
MADECTDCGIDIEPKAPKEEIDASTAAELPITPIEAVTTEEIKNEIPKDAEISGMLGLLTASCLLTEEAKREACWKGIEPLETNNEKPIETVTRIIKIEGAETLEKTLDALRDLVEEAKKAIEKE